MVTLRECGLEVIGVSESHEIVEGHAFNFVVIERDTVFLPDGTPGFRRFLEGLGIEVAACAPISEYANAAGGLGCATGILAREPIGTDVRGGLQSATAGPR